MRSHQRGGATALLVAFVLCLGLLGGCSDDGDASLLGENPTTGSVSATEAQRLLDQRTAAIRKGNLDGFLDTLDPTNVKLLDRQRRYYANMRALPLAQLRYTVLKSDWPGQLRATAWGKHVSLPQVRISTQLAGYDTEPVIRITGFAFARKHGRPVILSELTGSGQQFPGSSPAPWDLTRIHVRSGPTTLQVYDSGTWRSSDLINAAVTHGVSQVQDALPFTWDGRVVVYVFSRKAVLNSFEGVPGGNIKHLGAMTFPLYSVLGQAEIAGSRFTLLPSSVRAGQPFLDRITRHELTHVAVGDRDDGVPVWFAEGIAEYVGARPLPTRKRRIDTVAVNRARRGVSALPDSASFNGADQAWNYALAWMACDYVADTQGEPRLWELMDALYDNGEGTKDADQDAVLLRVLGMDGAELAHQAAKRILRIYG